MATRPYLTKGVLILALIFARHIHEMPARPTMIGMRKMAVAQKAWHTQGPMRAHDDSLSAR